MPSIFEKLNLKGLNEIVVLNAPASFEPAIQSLTEVKVARSVVRGKTIRFSLAFVTQQGELDKISKALCSQAEGDALQWFAYPRQSSKKYRCEFNRNPSRATSKQGKLRTAK
jgi:hypothetical protein